MIISVLVFPDACTHDVLMCAPILPPAALPSWTETASADRDVGVYVAITSLEPLLAYMHTGGVLLRFCSQEYVRNITQDTPTNAYVIYGLDDYLPASEGNC